MEGPWGQATAKGNSTGVKTVGVKGHSYYLYYWDYYSCKGGGVARGYFDIWASLTSVNRANTPPIVATIIKPNQYNFTLYHNTCVLTFAFPTLLFKQATNILQLLNVLGATT